MMSEQEFKDYISTLVIPEGWNGVFEEKKWFKNDPWLEFHLSNADKSITLQFKQLGDGTTLFVSNGKTLTFDRLGVESSFYIQKMWEKDDRDYNPNSILQEQLKRIEESKARIQTSVSVPGLGFSIQQDQLEASKLRLKKSGLRFSPSGFGQGKFLSTKKTNWNNRARPETEKFFGIAPLYVESFDCD